MKHYDALIAKSEEIGWPSHYTSDLTFHDRNILETWPEDRPFCWCVRQCGTHLIPPTCSDCYDWARAIASQSPKDSRYFVWTGTKLVEVTSAEWLSKLADYLKRLPTWRIEVQYELYRGRPLTIYRDARADDEDDARLMVQKGLRHNPPYRGCYEWFLGEASIVGDRAAVPA
jgi:hypothetical protein